MNNDSLPQLSRSIPPTWLSVRHLRSTSIMTYFPRTHTIYTSLLLALLVSHLPEVVLSYKYNNRASTTSPLSLTELREELEKYDFRHTLDTPTYADMTDIDRLVDRGKRGGQVGEGFHRQNVEVRFSSEHAVVEEITLMEALQKVTSQLEGVVDAENCLADLGNITDGLTNATEWAIQSKS